MRLALETDPLSILISHNLAGAYYGAGLEDQAIEQHFQTLELNPVFPAAHGQLAVLYSRRGACENALEEAERFLSLSGRDPRSRCFLAMVYANCGMRAEATACIENLEKETPFHGAGGFAPSFMPDWESGTVCSLALRSLTKIATSFLLFWRSCPSSGAFMATRASRICCAGSDCLPGRPARLQDRRRGDLDAASPNAYRRARRAIQVDVSPNHRLSKAAA